MVGWGQSLFSSHPDKAGPSRGRIFLEGFEESSEEGKLMGFLKACYCLIVSDVLWGAWDAPHFLDVSALGKSCIICLIRP